MQFQAALRAYLKGEKFSNGLKIRIAYPETSVLSRVRFLEAMVQGKKVIHLGCCDHLPLIEDKLRKGQWLHAKLDQSAGYCLGIDIDAESVEFVNTRLGYKQVLCRDITRDSIPEIDKQSWDFLVMGELLEHITDPHAFLSSIREKYGKRVNELVLTVPNGFNWDNILNTLKNREVINTDHINTFTPYTLAMLLSRAGFTVGEFFFTHEFNYKNAWRRRLRFLYHLAHPLRYLVIHRAPATRSTLVMRATF